MKFALAGIYMKDSKIFMNVASGFGGQLIAIIMGILVPRFFIAGYGSDVNGLISTITQIFTYLALLEAGIGQAAKNLLFRPFQDNNRDEISEIASISDVYFKRFTTIYAVGVIVLAILLPIILKTGVNRLTVSFIVLLEGMSGVITFYFTQTPSIIFGVDGKSYINNGINVVYKAIGYAVKIVMAAFETNIVLLQIVYFLVTVAKVIVYKRYFKKYYNWIKFLKFKKEKKLQDRNSYIIVEVCWTIFSSTDMIILSIFISTQLASVYSIYNMIFMNLSILLNSAYSSVNYLLGQMYHENKRKYVTLHDAFNSIFFGLITAIMMVCYYLAIPFISLYTKGVSDTNYIIPSLPFWFCLIQLLSWGRYISGNLVGVAGRIKKAVWVNILEAAINLSCSIVLVQKYGIEGILFATVISLPIKLVYCNYVGDVIILGRSCNKTIIILGTNFLVFLLTVLVKPLFCIEIASYTMFCIYSIFLSILFLGVVMILNIVLNPDIVRIVKQFIGRRHSL